jgi:cytochrome c
MNGIVRYYAAPLLVAATILAPSAVLGAGSQPAGNATAGHALIQKWCAECHLSDGAKTASDMAPPFGSLMADRKYTKEHLRTWLSDPHPPMPKIGLTRKMIRDIIAHLSTLRPTAR